MTSEQEEHLLDIKRSFALAVDKKYRKGQAEHGGDLVEASRTNLIDCAIDEAIDLYVYLTTLRSKLTRPSK